MSHPLDHTIYKTIHCVQETVEVALFFAGRGNLQTQTDLQDRMYGLLFSANVKYGMQPIDCISSDDLE